MKQKIVLLLCIVGIGTVFLLRFGFSPKRLTLFKLESRVSNVKTFKVDNDDFRTIGWLRVQGTDIDYPVLWTSDSAVDFPVEIGNSSWSYNHDDKLHNHMYIMGHNIFNLSSTPKEKDERFLRFEELMNFVYFDFAKENQYIQLTIDGKDYMYKIFAVDFLKPSDTYSLTYKDDYSKKEMKNYLDLLEKNNIYHYDIDINENDSVLSLVTCTRFFGEESKEEFFVTGRLLRENEKTEMAKVTKSDKYKRIEDKWEGDLKNESSSM